MNSRVTHHCSDNKSLFKKLKSLNKIVETVSDEILKIKSSDEIEISLDSNDVFVLIDVMYISDLVVNLIFSSRLYYKRFDVLQHSMKSMQICKNKKIIAKTDMINNQMILRIKFDLESMTKSLKDMSIKIAQIAASSIFEAHIFVFTKSIKNIRI